MATSPNGGLSWLVILAIAGACWHSADGVLQVGFYDSTCTGAEYIVKDTVRAAVAADRTIAASLIRLHFHDCFVKGCDASILLTGSNSEQAAGPNLSVRGYGTITDAKIQLEASCPGVVSCADIVALAACDAVEILGGAYYAAETGRFDGAAPGAVSLPSPDMSVDQVAPFFANLGLTLDDMVTLLGAHTVGVAQCQFFVARLYNFQGTAVPDPALDPAFLATLQSRCPDVSGDLTTVALDDASEFSFDSNYYRNLQARKGVLQIDQEIANDARTGGRVNALAAPTGNFGAEFGVAMVAMGRIGVLASGSVRAVCSSP